jgi:hypothetical protein
LLRSSKSKDFLSKCDSKDKPKKIKPNNVMWYEGWDPGSEKIKPKET